MKKNCTDKRLLSWLATKKFVKENQHILFMRADKDNVTVVLNRNDYIKNMDEMLSDNNTYLIVKKDPSRTIIIKLRD